MRRGVCWSHLGEPWSTVDPAAATPSDQRQRGMLSPRRSVAVHLEPFGTVRSRDPLDIGSCRGYPFLPEWPGIRARPEQEGGADRGKAACSYGARRRCAGAGWSQLCVRVRLHPRLVVAEGPAAVDEVGKLVAVRSEHAGGLSGVSDRVWRRVDGRAGGMRAARHTRSRASLSTLRSVSASPLVRTRTPARAVCLHTTTRTPPC